MLYTNYLLLVVSNETPTPTVNGVATVFTTANAYRSGTLKVFRSGVRLYGSGVDYSETTSTTFTLNVAPDTGETLLVEYIKQSYDSTDNSDNLLNILAKIRNIIGENAVSDKDIFVFESSRVFTLGDINVQEVTAVLKNGTEVDESGNWSYSSTTNKLTFENDYSFTVGDTIEVQYTKYPNYSDDELTGYLKASLSWISVYKYKTFFIANNQVTPIPSEDEENLIALVAGVLIKPDNKSYKLPDLGVQVPINSVPIEQMIAQIVSRFKRSPTGIFKVIK